LKDYIACVLFLFVFDNLLRAYPNIESNTFFAEFVQIAAKLLILKKRNVQILCIVLVVFFEPGLKCNKNNDLTFVSRTK